MVGNDSETNVELQVRSPERRLPVVDWRFGFAWYLRRLVSVVTCDERICRTTCGSHVSVNLSHLLVHALWLQEPITHLLKEVDLVVCGNR